MNTQEVLAALGLTAVNAGTWHGTDANTVTNADAGWAADNAAPLLDSIS